MHAAPRHGLAPCLWDSDDHTQRLQAFLAQHVDYGYGLQPSTSQLAGSCASRKEGEHDCSSSAVRLLEVAGQGQHVDEHAHVPTVTPCASIARSIDSVRATEFTRLAGTAACNTAHSSGRMPPVSVYLDYGGAALYSERQVREACEELAQQLLANPHSAHTQGSPAAQAEAALRSATLALCNADGAEYDVVLTAGATAALKLVAECLPWSAGSSFVYTLQNHNSVLGIREVACALGAQAQAVEIAAAAGGVRADGRRSVNSGSGPAVRLVPVGAAMAPGQSSAASLPPRDAGSRAQADRSGGSDVRSNGPDAMAAGVAGGSGGAGLLRAILSGLKTFLGGPTAPVATSQPATPAGAAGGGTGTCESASVNVRGARAEGQAGGANGTLRHPSVQLFAMPTECNFSGQQLDLRLVQTVQQHGPWADPLPLEVSSSAVQPDQRAGTTATSSSPSTSVTQGGNGLGGQPVGQLQLPPQSGVQRPQAAQQQPGVQQLHPPGGRWLVLLDAAKGASTSPPDLSRFPADLVVLSYYKIFGHPTGLGALLVRRQTAAPLLAAGKKYFGGGTVAVSVADAAFMRRRPGHAGLEDGTLPFTSVNAALHGFRYLARLGGMRAVHAHACTLAEHLASSLCSLRHSNGAPAAIVYGRVLADAPGVSGSGPTVAFNLRKPDGSWVGYTEVARLAALHAIHLRTGCFCNPGACAKYLGLTGAELAANYMAGHVCWDERDVIHGRPTGAVRASLGHASSFDDVYVLLRFLEHYFVDHSPPQLAPSSPLQQAAQSQPQPAPTSSTDPVERAQHGQQPSPDPSPTLPRSGSDTGTLAAMYLYPIKSCGAQEVRVWPVGPHGLLLDREWALLDDEGKVVTQKSCPAAARVSATVDLSTATLTLSAPAAPAPLVIRIPELIPQPKPVVTSPPATGTVVEGHAAACASGHLSSNGVSSEASNGNAAGSTISTGHGIIRVSSPGNGVSSHSSSGTSVSTHTSPGNEVSDHPGAIKHGRAVNGTAGSSSSAVTGGTPAARGLEIQVCGDRVCSTVVGEEVLSGSLESSGSARGEAVVRTWFKQAIGLPCRLVRATQGAREARKGTAGLGHTGKASASASQPGLSTTTRNVLDGIADGGAAASPLLAAAESTTSAASSSGGTAAPEETSAQQAPGVGFANDGQFLLVNAASVHDVNTRIRTLRSSSSGINSSSGNSSSNIGIYGTSGATYVAPTGASSAAYDEGRPPTIPAQGQDSGSGPASSTAATAATAAASPAGSEQPVELLRFRPNLVISGLPPYAEDSWGSRIQVGALACDVLGTCPRCEMLQVDQTTGVRGKADVLLALAQYRRLNGRMHFGVLLSQAHALGGADSGSTSGTGGTTGRVSSIGAAASAASAASAADRARGAGAHNAAHLPSTMPAVKHAAGEEGVIEHDQGQAGRQQVAWMRQTFGAVLCVGDLVQGC